MMIQTPSTSVRRLHILTLSTALLFGAPKLHAQDCATDLVTLEAALIDLETLGNEIADQRDRCFSEAEKNRKQRDRCEGAFGELSRSHRELTKRFAEAEDARLRAEHAARRQKRLRGLWYGLGFATPIATALAVGFVYTYLTR